MPGSKTLAIIAALTIVTTAINDNRVQKRGEDTTTVRLSIYLPTIEA